MRCIKCGSENLKTIDSRPTKGNSTRRRKKCENCGCTFTTYEEISFERANIVKVKNSDGVISRYSPAKLVSSIIEQNPNYEDIAVEISKKINGLITKREGSSIESSELIDLVSNELKKIDYNAYVRYACNYITFVPKEKQTDE